MWGGFASRLFPGTVGYPSQATGSGVRQVLWAARVNGMERWALVISE